jgi:hypothetical protein
VGIGAAGSNQQSEITQLRGQVTSLHSQLVTARAEVASADAAMNKAQVAQQNAQATADKAAAAKYASKVKTVQQMQHKLAHELGVVARSTISADGVYVVGRDIPAGTYHTSGNGGGVMNQCYFATLGSTDTSNIMDNNNFNGPETVDVSGAYAFQITGGCTWHKVG